MLLFVSLGCSIIILSGIYLTYQLFQVVYLDAKYRHIKKPKLWAWFSISGQHSEGLILYLLTRKKHPREAFSDDDFLAFQKGKKKAIAAFIFEVIGVVLFLIGICFYH